MNKADILAYCAAGAVLGMAVKMSECPDQAGTQYSEPNHSSPTSSNYPEPNQKPKNLPPYLTPPYNPSHPLPPNHKNLICKPGGNSQEIRDSGAIITTTAAMRAKCTDILEHPDLYNGRNSVPCDLKIAVSKAETGYSVSYKLYTGEIPQVEVLWPPYAPNPGIRVNSSFSSFVSYDASCRQLLGLNNAELQAVIGTTPIGPNGTKTGKCYEPPKVCHYPN